MEEREEAKKEEKEVENEEELRVSDGMCIAHAEALASDSSRL